MAQSLARAFDHSPTDRRHRHSQGPDFVVNNEAVVGAPSPEIATNANGDFVIVWHSDELLKPASHVWLRRFNAKATPLAPQVRVDGTARPSSHSPAIAMNSAGDFVVVWHASVDSAVDEIRGRRYSAGGSALGSEFVIATTRHFYTSAYVRVAMDDAGNFTVVWSEDKGTGKTYEDIYRRRFSSSGTALEPVVRVNTTTVDDQRHFDIAMDATGNSVVVWANATTSADRRVFVQRFNGAGVAVGGELSAALDMFAVRPVNVGVTMARATGNFTVTWARNDGNIYYRHYLPDATPVGEEARASTIHSSYAPRIASDADGDFSIVWSNNASGGPGDASGRRFTGSERVDLSVRSTDLVDPVPAGEPLSYKVDVYNHHATTSVATVGIATGIVVVGTPSAGVMPLDAFGDGWDCVVTTEFRCTYAALLTPSMATAPLYLSTSTPLTPGEITLTLQADGHHHDAVPTNNRHVERSTVL